MKLYFIKTALFTTATIALFSCQTGDDPVPVPVEQELVTTVKLIVTNSSGFNKTFTYKVENGFGSTTPGTVTKDEVILEPNKEYNLEVQLLNEKKTPVENITEEVISENNDHLFIYQATPAGLLTFTNGSKDAANNPFNQRLTLTTTNAGSGELTVTLKHNPTNKNATTPDAAGGETDAEANFTVKVQ
jgi:hypothetical protein